MPVIFSYDSQVAVNRNNFGTIYFSLLSDSFLQIFPVYQNFTKRLFHVHFVDNVDNFVYKSKIAVLGLSCMWITLSCLSLPLALLCELRELVCESCTTSLLSTVSSEKKEVRQFLPKHSCAALRRTTTHRERNISNGNQKSKRTGHERNQRFVNAGLPGTSQRQAGSF